MKNIYRYIYILVIIFLAGAGVARAVGTLNFDQATDAFVIDGKLTFNNPSRVNLFLKQLASKVTSPFYFNADKDLQFRVGQLTGATPSYAFIVSKSDGSQVFNVDNDGNLSLGVNIANDGSLFTVDHLGNVSANGTAKLVGGLYGNTFNFGSGLMSFSGQSLDFGITPNSPNYRWFHEGDGDNLMTLTSGGDLWISKSISGKELCLNSVCISKWEDAVNVSTYLRKDVADPKIINAVNFGFGGGFETNHAFGSVTPPPLTSVNYTACAVPNPFATSTNPAPDPANGGCSCPQGYTRSDRVTNTSGVGDLYFCYKKNNPS